jgi:3-oxoacyl-[acyl-carrier protein] reductase
VDRAVISKRLAKDGVTVVVNYSRNAETDMLYSMISPEWQQNLIAETPLGWLGMPEDIADVVAFLVSKDARWITGEIIAATGGL